MPLMPAEQFQKTMEASLRTQMTAPEMKLLRALAGSAIGVDSATFDKIFELGFWYGANESVAVIKKEVQAMGDKD